MKGIFDNCGWHLAKAKVKVILSVLLLTGSTSFVIACSNPSKATDISKNFSADASAINKSSSAVSSGDYLAYEGNFHEEVVKPQAEAWKKVAKVIYPRVCDDIETQWAAQVADSLANDLISRPELSHPEQMARLSEIQYHLTYGMSYFAAIIGLHRTSGLAEDAMDMMSKSTTFIDSVKNVGNIPPRELIGYELGAYVYVGLFMDLSTYDDDGTTPKFVENNQVMLNNTYYLTREIFKGIPDETQAFRYSMLVNNTAFYMTYCPLAFWLAGPEWQKAHQEEYTDMARWFDEKASKVSKPLSKEALALLPAISLEDFSAYMRQAALYKTRLITLLSEAILSLPEM